MRANTRGGADDNPPRPHQRRPNASLPFSALWKNAKTTAVAALATAVLLAYVPSAMMSHSQYPLLEMSRHEPHGDFCVEVSTRFSWYRDEIHSQKYPAGACMIHTAPLPDPYPQWHGRRLPQLDERTDARYSEFATGWPIRCVFVSQALSSSVLVMDDGNRQHTMHYQCLSPAIVLGEDDVIDAGMNAAPSPRRWIVSLDVSAIALSVDVIVLFLVLQTAWCTFHGVRAALRRRSGRCTACGYDLRGAACTSDTCSECGRPLKSVR